MTARNEQPSVAMHWPDTISSYKCFETIATPSPIPIAKAASQTAATLSVHSTSLDSLADSELTEPHSRHSRGNHDSRDSRDSRNCSHSSGSGDSGGSGEDCVGRGGSGGGSGNNSGGDNSCNSSGDCCDCIHSDTDQLTECDSIDNCYDDPRMPSIDSEWIDPNRCDDYERPIVTDFVRKVNVSGDRQCVNRACTFRQFSECHSVNVCAPDSSDLFGRDPNDSKPVVISIREPKEYNSRGGLVTAPPPLPLPPNLGQKLRRASCGSVGRMETIIESPIEDPIEPKISVKEILQRFETLTSLEVELFVL